MAATRTGPPTPRPGRPQTGPSAAPAGTPTAPLPQDTTEALRLLSAMADADGLVAVDLRALAAELDLTTVATRALLAALVEAGALGAAGRRVFSLAGSRAATADPAEPRGPRTAPHDAVHEGTGSPLLW